MTGLARVPARVPIGGGVAAPDLPAGHAHPQVHPRAADRQTLLAALDRRWQRRHPDVVEVATGCHCRRKRGVLERASLISVLELRLDHSRLLLRVPPTGRGTCHCCGALRSGALRTCSKCDRPRMRRRSAQQYRLFGQAYPDEPILTSQTVKSARCASWFQAGSESRTSSGSATSKCRGRCRSPALDDTARALRSGGHR